MEKLVHSHGVERNFKEIVHHIAHLGRVEAHSNRILHPRVGHQNPQSRQRHAGCRKPCGGKVEALAHTVPAEEHYCHKCSLHKECHNALYGKGRTEYVADKPTIVRPVGAEFKFENKAGGHAARKIDAEKRHPKLGDAFPAFTARMHIYALHYGHYERQAYGKRHKEPMVHCCKSELRSRPVN